MDLLGDALAARYLTVGGAGGAAWDGERTTPLHWQDGGCARVVDGTAEVEPLRMEANSVWLLELRPDPRCAERTAKSIPGGGAQLAG